MIYIINVCSFWLSQIFGEINTSLVLYELHFFKKESKTHRIVIMNVKVHGGQTLVACESQVHHRLASFILYELGDRGIL